MLLLMSPNPPFLPLVLALATPDLPVGMALNLPNLWTLLTSAWLRLFDFFGRRCRRRVLAALTGLDGDFMAVTPASGVPRDHAAAD